MLPFHTPSRFLARIKVGIAGLVFVGVFVVASRAGEAWLRLWV